MVRAAPSDDGAVLRRRRRSARRRLSQRYPNAANQHLRRHDAHFYRFVPDKIGQKISLLEGDNYKMIKDRETDRKRDEVNHHIALKRCASSQIKTSIPKYRMLFEISNIKSLACT